MGLGVMLAKLREFLSALNRRRKAKLPSPYVSRAKFQDVETKYQCLVSAITSLENPLTNQPELRSLQSMSFRPQDKEICLFVSYSPVALIKSHVRHHIKALRRANIAVALVINVDDVNADLSQLDVADLDLSGLYIRPNVGFDFAAWSQLYAMLEASVDPDRLYLANDSMIGPLSDHMFEGMMDKIHQSSADLVGLLANPTPQFHLQSFFLVLNRAILVDYRLKIFFKTLWCLPTYDMVIDFYEVRLTQLIQSWGFVAAPLYEIKTAAYQKTNLVIFNLDELLKLDFPYVKTSMACKAEGQKILGKYNIE
jgi:lipopolysaccharide biosynthesis protein